MGVVGSNEAHTTSTEHITNDLAKENMVIGGEEAGRTED